MTLVTRMGFEPMYTALRGQRVKPLHQRVVSQYKIASSLYQNHLPNTSNIFSARRIHSSFPSTCKI